VRDEEENGTVETGCNGGSEHSRHEKTCGHTLGGNTLQVYDRGIVRPSQPLPHASQRLFW
jgi:hypothetical protein